MSRKEHEDSKGNTGCTGFLLQEHVLSEPAMLSWGLPLEISCPNLSRLLQWDPEHHFPPSLLFCSFPSMSQIRLLQQLPRSEQAGSAEKRQELCHSFIAELTEHLSIQ